MANKKMSLAAQLTVAGPLDERAMPRYGLRLQSQAETSDCTLMEAIIHNLSADGLLIQAEAPIAVGSTITVDLPTIGEIIAEVTRVSGRFVGAAFQTRLPSGSLRAMYSAAKKAIESFTESWARELGARNITVNTVVPGATSPGMMDASPEYREFMENASPFRRIGHADEIAAVVAFLASPEASWVSGTHVMANGAANT